MPSRATAIRSFYLQLRTESYPYRVPMKFGGRIVNDVTVASVDCDVETGQGRGCGLGAMTMGVAWAWPNATTTDRSTGLTTPLSDATKLQVVLELIKRLIDLYHDHAMQGHPLDICHTAAARYRDVADEIRVKLGLSESIPDLAIRLAASPIEAALFDAHGKAAGMSSYRMLHRPYYTSDLSSMLGPAYADVFLDELLSSTPAAKLPVVHLVGALDPLVAADAVHRVDDGLPETLQEWIGRNDLTHLKIKLAGDDLSWDTQRVCGVHRVATQTRPELGANWFFSLDFNERCEDQDYVLQLLERINAQQPQAVRCIAYAEQPTDRDLTRLPAVTMHDVAERLPVVIDESLTGLPSLRRAIELGYSGIAIKACKGHHEALLMAAVAIREGLYLCVQDLTCVGASLLHSASLAAHLPGVTAIESNGRQYCPQGNQRWLNHFAEFFEIRGGVMPTAQLCGAGLGYGDDPALACE